MPTLKQKILKTPHLGLLPLPQDDKDFGMADVFSGAYQPKHTKQIIPTLSVKKQSYNSCGWSSSTIGKEIDERVLLSVRGLVIKAKREGYISRDGFSNLRNNEKVLQKFGIPEEKDLSENSKNWEDYSNYRLWTSEIEENALKHRSKTYLSINNSEEIYKAIDDGRTVKIGVNWYTGNNNLRHPYILEQEGWYVGGHAMVIVGYNSNYYGAEVAVIQNSFGKKYGDNGLCYIEMSELDKYIRRYGAYVNYDFSRNVTEWLVKHTGKIVKADNLHVYYIWNGKKRRFIDLACLYAHGHIDSEIITVEADALHDIPEGREMNFWEGSEVKTLKAIIQQKENLKPIFNKYFTELFK